MNSQYISFFFSPAIHTSHIHTYLGLNTLQAIVVKQGKKMILRSKGCFFSFLLHHEPKIPKRVHPWEDKGSLTITLRIEQSYEKGYRKQGLTSLSLNYSSFLQTDCRQLTLIAPGGRIFPSGSCKFNCCSYFPAHPYTLQNASVLASVLQKGYPIPMETSFLGKQLEFTCPLYYYIQVKDCI